MTNLRLAPARENTIVEEIAQHLDELYEALLSSSVTPTEAQQQTLAELRGSEFLRRELRRVVLLIGVAAMASFIPARRASRIDPMAALRHE